MADMRMAFVMPKVEGKKLPEIIKRISDINEVLALYAITGDFDLLVVSSTPNYDAIGKTIIENILQIDGIKESRTNMAFKIYKYSR